MAQVVDPLTSKHEALSSNPGTIKKKKKKRERERERERHLGFGTQISAS
jgi:hypothetical protein